MITSKNLIEVIVALRLYTYSPNPDSFMVFESMPEEGDDVKKKLGKFKTAEEMNTFLEEYKEQLRIHLQAILNVKPKARRKKTPEHPNPREIRKKLKCASSPLTLKLPDSTLTSIVSSSSEPSSQTSETPSSP